MAGTISSWKKTRAQHLLSRTIGCLLDSGLMRGYGWIKRVNYCWPGSFLLSEWRDRGDRSGTRSATSFEEKEDRTKNGTRKSNLRSDPSRVKFYFFFFSFRSEIFPACVSRMKPIIIPSIRIEIHNEKSVKEKNNQKHEDNVEDIGNDIKKEREKGWTQKRAKRVSLALDPLSKEGEKERGSLAWRGWHGCNSSFSSIAKKLCEKKMRDGNANESKGAWTGLVYRHARSTVRY